MTAMTAIAPACSIDHERSDVPSDPVLDRAARPVRTAQAARRASFSAGAQAMLPLLIGIVPFGIVVGVTIAERDISPVAGLATGWVIYAGSAQLVAIELVDSGAAPLIAIVTVLAMNARLLLYSSAMARHWRTTSRSWKALAAYLLVDPSFLVGSDGYEKPNVRGHAYYLGAGLTLWSAWQAAIIFGLTAGDVIPTSLQLEFAVPLYLVAMLVTRTSSRAARAAATTAGVVAIASSALPLRTGLFVAILAGIAVGAVTLRHVDEDRSTP